MDRIRILREERDESQKELAEFLQVSPSTLSKWERGEFEPGKEMLCKLAGHFNVSIDYLLDFTDIRNRYNIKKRDLLREYLIERYNRYFTDFQIDIIEEIIQAMEHYKRE